MYEIYNVKDNDTLDSIANTYGIDKELIFELNDIDRCYDSIKEKQIILPKQKNEIFKYYKVKSGDTIDTISKQNTIDKYLLLKLNGIEESLYIYPNQTIILPKEGVNLYITKEGDTLNEIIESTNSSIDTILDNNNNIYLQEEQLIVLNKTKN